MDKFQRRTWAEINLDLLEENLYSIKSSLSSRTKVMAVIKADGYGHGDRVIAQSLEDLGVDFFAVSNLEEGISLRSDGSNAQILILGYTPIEDVPLVKKYSFIQTIYSLEYAKAVNQVCINHGITIEAHVKLDTGMNRLGFTVDDLDNLGSINIDEIKQLYSLEGINIKGYFSHLSSADMDDEESTAYTRYQADTFFKAVDKIRQCGHDVGEIHIQNSAGASCYPSISDNNHCDYARMGIILYGIDPCPYADGIKVKPILELKSVVAMVKTVKAGVSVGYGRRFVAESDTAIATIPIGYADGYSRRLSQVGRVLINGCSCPIVGNICMDQLMVDVSNVEVKTGDIVTLIGSDGNQTITFDEVAQLTGTISYEVVCVIGRRVPRVYIKNGRIINAVEYINRKKFK